MQELKISRRWESGPDLAKESIDGSIQVETTSHKTTDKILEALIGQDHKPHQPLLEV